MNLQIFLTKVKKMRIAEMEYSRLRKEGASRKQVQDFYRHLNSLRNDVDLMITAIEKNLTIQNSNSS